MTLAGPWAGAVAARSASSNVRRRQRANSSRLGTANRRANRPGRSDADLAGNRLRPAEKLSSESRALLRDPPGPLEVAHLLAFTSLRSVVGSTETTPAFGRLENEISAMPNEAPPVLKKPLLETHEGPALNGNGQDKPRKGCRRANGGYR